MVGNNPKMSFDINKHEGCQNKGPVLPLLAVY
jgi:hypothetical protein